MYRKRSSNNLLVGVGRDEGRGGWNAGEEEEGEWACTWICGMYVRMRICYVIR